MFENRQQQVAAWLSLQSMGDGLVVTLRHNKKSADKHTEILYFHMLISSFLPPGADFEF